MPDRSAYISFITLGLSFNLPGFKPGDELQFKCKPIDNELTSAGTKKSEWQHERSKDVLKFPPNIVRFYKILSVYLNQTLISICSSKNEIFHLYFFYINKLPKCVYRCHDDPMPEFDFNGVQYLRNWTLQDNGIGAIATYECRRNNSSFSNQIE